MKLISSNMENMNDSTYLNERLNILLKQLHSLEAVPGLAMESGLHPKVDGEGESECVDT